MAWPAFAEAVATPAAPGVPASAILQTALGLLAVIGVLFFAAYLLRRANGGRGFGASGPLRMVGGLMIGTRERIVVVEIEDTWIVVGLAPGQMRTLHTLPRGELPATSGAEGDFASRLAQMIGRKS
ncbi:flagellar biosynthetic protein FliO [Rhodocyclus tenuis]|uniref:Flagellar protein n=1 Tax=Rhodocyclus tenuis TaxID=1066 RepID=A0A840FX66_RHOTE|nr:flagellar biosynthetic protein FliO [Rhodocyclus tenuis]MBB4246687.1 flagellar protein FliO/FliZ [Rhodocyclus tenuis]